jgi:hypothetical protein
MRWTAFPVYLLALLPALGSLSCKKAELPAQPIKGAVLEKLDASVYTYLRLKTSAGEVWAAVPRSDVEVGAEVVVQQPKRMDGFESQSLNRRFDRIVFGTLAGQRGTPALTQGSRPCRRAIRRSMAHRASTLRRRRKWPSTTHR